MQLKTAFTNLLRHRGKNVLPQLIEFAVQESWKKIDQASIARLPCSPETAIHELVGVDDNLRMLVYATISPHEDSKKTARQFMQEKALLFSMQLPQDPQEKWYPIKAFLDSLENPKTVAHIDCKANKDCGDIPPIQLDLFRFLAKHREIKTSADFIKSVIALSIEGVRFGKGETLTGKFWGTAGRNEILKISQEILDAAKTAGIDVAKPAPSPVDPLTEEFKPSASAPPPLSDEQQAKADAETMIDVLTEWHERTEAAETAGRLPGVGKHPSLAHIGTKPAPPPIRHPSLDSRKDAALG